jgi:hypothetical protein
MRTFRTFIIFISFLLPLSGCLVYSLNPFYTKEKIIEYPSVIGTWECVKGCDDAEIPLGKDWQFTENSVRVTDREGRQSNLVARYFKVGETVFLDTTIHDLDSLAAITSMHLLPAHLLTKVEMDTEKEMLTLTTLNYNWFNGAELEMPFTNIDDVRVFIATPEQWIAFLEKHRSSKDIYDEEDSITLKRKKIVSPE